jgi:predicted small metal-binding protein
MFSIKALVQPKAAAYCHVCAWKVTATSSEAALDGVIEHVEFKHPMVHELVEHPLITALSDKELFK